MNTDHVQNAEVELINVIVLLFLSFEAYEDFKFHSVSLNSLVCFGVTGIIIDIFYGINVEAFFCGILIGTGIILFGLIFKGVIGAGDGILFIILGIYPGDGCMKLFINSLIIASAVSVIILLLGKKNCEIPFIPCVLIAYMEVMLLEN